MKGIPLAALLAVISVTQLARADDGDKSVFDRLKGTVKMKTLGGRQFWGDVSYFHGWRIQQNIISKHYRLLDKNDVRHASGKLEECRAELERIKKDQKLPPMKGKAVVLVHGIIRSSKSMGKLQDRLEKEGYTVFAFDYPSTRVSIPESAEYLAKCIDSLKGIEEINFVVHSMGGLIVRQYISKHKDKRIKRMVMLAVPNLGAHMADKVQNIKLYKMLFGPAGQELVTDKNGLIFKLPTPKFEFAIIAGARGHIKGYNPLIPGDDDGTVSVSSTRLPGAADFMTVKSLHSFIMGNDEVIESTVRFLKKGYFRADGKRHPIMKPKPKAPEKVGK